MMNDGDSIINPTEVSLGAVLRKLKFVEWDRLSLGLMHMIKAYPEGTVRVNDDGKFWEILWFTHNINEKIVSIDPY